MVCENAVAWAGVARSGFGLLRNSKSLYYRILPFHAVVIFEFLLSEVKAACPVNMLQAIPFGFEKRHSQICSFSEQSPWLLSQFSFHFPCVSGYRISSNKRPPLRPLYLIGTPLNKQPPPLSLTFINRICLGKQASIATLFSTFLASTMAESLWKIFAFSLSHFSLIYSCARFSFFNLCALNK